MAETSAEKQNDEEVQLAMVDLKRRMEDQDRRNRLLSLNIDRLLPASDQSKDNADVPSRKRDSAGQFPHASMRLAMLDMERRMEVQERENRFLGMQMDFVMRGNVGDAAQEQLTHHLVRDCAQQPKPGPVDPVQWQADYAEIEQAMSELEQRMGLQKRKLRLLMKDVRDVIIQDTRNIWMGLPTTKRRCANQFVLEPCFRPCTFDSGTLDYLIFFYKWYQADEQSGWALTEVKLDNWDECETPHVVVDFLRSQATVFETLSIGTPTRGILDCVTTALLQCGSTSSIQHLEIKSCDLRHGCAGMRSLMLAKQDWLSISLDWVRRTSYDHRGPECAQMISEITNGVAMQTRMEKFTFKFAWSGNEKHYIELANLFQVLCSKLQTLRVVNLRTSCEPMAQKMASVNAFLALLESRENQLEELRWTVDDVSMGIDWFMFRLKWEKRVLMAIAQNQSLRSWEVTYAGSKEIQAVVMRNCCTHKVRKLMLMEGSVSLLEWGLLLETVATSSHRTFSPYSAVQTTASASALYLALVNSTSLKLHLWTTLPLKRAATGKLDTSITSC